MNETSPHVRDIIQEHIQLANLLEQEVCIRTSKEINLSPDRIEKVVKQLTGVPDPDLHWFLTYLENHFPALNMIQYRVDPFLSFQIDNKSLSILVVLQVEDSYRVGTESLLRTEEEMSVAFLSKT